MLEAMNCWVPASWPTVADKFDPAHQCCMVGDGARRTTEQKASRLLNTGRIAKYAMICCKDVIDFADLAAVAEEGCSTRGGAVPPTSKNAAEVIASTRSARHLNVQVANNN